MKKTKEEILQKMIDNRETELQRCYDIAIDKKMNIEYHIDFLSKEIERKKDELLTVNAMIEKCKRRASEQNCLHIL